VSDFADKVRSLAFVAGGRTRDTRVVEGRCHPQTGVAFKTTITEAGRITEHATSDDRVDAVATPTTLTVTRAQTKEQTHGG
jgi:hypothetical protein